ncbi:unnamed protein product [Paramecium octaurelia]|uniref:Ubiquitin-like protease family profile domain-containing protein n=1 Tax=Paramecium octaurelia TaxID=43137 RepID=A0A8S1VZ72_PAROT|nr:unnamed protein product [Paramecium octaurelia]
MSKGEEYRGKQPKISEFEFNSEEQYKEFIRKTNSDGSEGKQPDNNNSVSNHRENYSFKTGNDQNYSELLQEQYQQYASPQSYKLEEMKIYHIDMDIENSNKKQLKNLLKSKNDVEVQRQNDKPQEKIDDNMIEIKTRTHKIIIQEIGYQRFQSDNIQINIPQNIKEQSQSQQKYININIGQSSSDGDMQKQSSEQHEIIEQSSQQSSIQLTHNENAERYERYDEIRDNQCRIKMQLKRFELILFEKGVQKQQKKNERFEKDYQISVSIENGRYVMQKPTYPFIIYNQQIGQKDRQALLNSKLFLTSSILNAYANYLQVRDENYYFSLNKNERIKHKRLFIFNSDFLTNCNLNDKTAQIQDKVLYLMLQYLQDFQVIQYQFWLIYKKIAFVVNSNNVHWYLAVLDFQDGILKIYDSLPQSSSSYNILNNLLSQSFSKLSQQNITFTTVVCPTWVRQQDHYSCGYHTCIALEYLSQYTAQNQLLTLEEIKKILRKLLINEENQNNQL